MPRVSLGGRVLSALIRHKFHQTPLSRTLRRTPGVNFLAQRWWLSSQKSALRTALTSLDAPLHPRTGDPRSTPDIPALLEIAKRDPLTVDRGDEFSAAMATWCNTSKFHCHGYQDVYSRILSHLRMASLRILEVGIGVNDPQAPSGMGIHHQPGASLVGWAHYFTGAQVHGADIDRRVLIDTSLYTTHWVDQRDVLSLSALALEVGSPIDVIVDDGLHTPEANGLTIMALLPYLAPEGVFVVEDILPEWDHLWNEAQHWIRREYGLAFYPGAALRGNLGAGLAVLWRNQ